MPRLPLGVILLAVLAVLSGCASTESSAAAPTSSAPAEPSSTADVPISTEGPTTTTTSAAVVGASPARSRLDWVVGLFARSAVDLAAIEDGFSPEFLAAVPLETLVEAVGSVVAADTGWRVVDASGLGELDGTAVAESATGRRIVIELAVEPDAPHRIAGLLVRPELPVVFAEGEPVTAAAIDAELAAVGGRAGYGLFELVGDECRLVAGLAPETPLPLGSAFKLWVLGALALEIDAGRATWDEPLAVEAAWLSSLDGEVAARAPGTELTLRQYAEWMIAISDNSATDHLMYRLGRPVVEAAMAAAGVADPASNRPMLSTRELFLLKWGTTVPAAEYLALDERGRRQVLDERLAGIGLVEELGATFRPTAPAAVEELEWFATPLDLCRTHAWLAALADRPGLEPVAEILALNPGLPFAERWRDVRFKGGSEPGVMFAAWRLEQIDGRVFVVAGGLVDRDRTFDDLRVASILAAVAELAPAPT